MAGPTLPGSVQDDRVVLHYLTPADHPWLGRLVELRAACTGLKVREWETRLAASDLEVLPAARRRFALRELSLRSPSRTGSAIAPPRIRETVFAARARMDGDRDQVVEAAAAELEVPTDAVEEGLFADLPGERILLPLDLSVAELALRANLAMLRAALARAASVRLDVWGRARAVVRYARMRGLLCEVQAARGDTAARLQLSGPLALFRRTLLYGRALGDLVPLLAWCRHFVLAADCDWHGRRAQLEVRTGDPIFPSRTPRPYDSRVEERLARDLAREAPHFDVVREPAPVAAGDRLVFPDFALVSRDDPRVRWWLEIVGFWTPGYLQRKLADYRAARLDRLLLCVDADRDCGPADLPAGARVVRYRRRVPVAEVLEIVEGREAPGPWAFSSRSTSGTRTASGEGATGRPPRRASARSTRTPGPR